MERVLKNLTFFGKKLLKILSNVEAKIDFPEDDLPEDVIKNIKIDSEKIRKEIEKNFR